MPALVSRIILLGLLFWAPAALGSNAPAFWATNAGLTAAALVLAVLAIGERGTSPTAWRVPPLLLVAAFGLVAWMLLQGVPGIGNPTWKALALADHSATMSLAPEASWTAATNFTTLLAAGLTATLVAADKTGARAILLALLTSATAIAFYGLILIALHSNTILWLEKSAYVGSLTGVFVNRNHTAISLGFGLTVATTLLLCGDATKPELQFLARFPAPIRRAMLVAAGAILFVALLRTGSRAGVAASLLGVMTVIALSLRGRRPARPLPWTIGAIAVAALFLALAGRPLLSRFLRLIPDFADRALVYRYTLAAIADRPLSGHGAGSFATLFPLYRGTEISPDLTWLYAHDTYLEMAAEIGLPLVGLGLAILVYAIWVMARAVARSGTAYPSTIAALGTSAIVGVHSLFDFSLEIQGIALPFAILLGSGLGAALADARERPAPAAVTLSPRSEARRRHAALLVSGMIAAVLALGAIRLGVIAFGTPPYLALGGAQTLVDAEADFPPPVVRRAEIASRYANSAAFFPPLYGDCARWPNSTRPADKCIAILDAALTNSPFLGELWVEKARLSILSGRGSEALSAIASAHAVTPNEGWLALRRARVLLLAGLTLPDESAQVLRDDVEVVLKSTRLSAALAQDFATDPVVRSALAKLLEESPNPDGALRFLQIVRSQASRR